MPDAGERRREGKMADARDTDRMAGDLLKAVLGSMNKPAVGGQARPQADERSMLSTIKDFLGQSTPGAKEQAKPAATPTPQTTTPTMGWLPESAWKEMYLRQEQERNAMYSRQAQEVEDVNRRHKREMEGLAGMQPAPEKTEREPALRPLPRRREPVARERDRSSKAAGITPGKNVGRWAVTTESGTKNFIAVSQEQAFREAQRQGLEPRTARLLEVRSYSEDELKEMYSNFGRPGRRESAQAEFERAIQLGLIPEDADFEMLENREWGYRVGTGRVLRKSSDLFERLRRR
jgi:hypothetical protein